MRYYSRLLEAGFLVGASRCLVFGQKLCVEGPESGPAAFSNKRLDHPASYTSPPVLTNHSKPKVSMMMRVLVSAPCHIAIRYYLSIDIRNHVDDILPLYPY